jgi:hypothetical protein
MWGGGSVAIRTRGHDIPRLRRKGFKRREDKRGSLPKGLCDYARAINGTVWMGKVTDLIQLRRTAKKRYY